MDPPQSPLNRVHNGDKPPVVQTSSIPRRSSAEVYFSEDLLSPVTYFSDQSTASESSFYDYLLANPNENSSNIRKELFETFNATGTSETFNTENLRSAIPGYVLLSNISSDLYRGFHRGTKRSVLVKYVSYMSAGSTSRFFNEWYTLSGLNCKGPTDDQPPDIERPRTLPLGIEGILYPVDFVSIENNGGYALIYDDVLNLRSFNEVFVMGRVKDNARILSALISCAETLRTVHSHRITHNGLTSSNILINDANEVFITGWDFCFSFHSEDCTRGYRTLNKRYLIDWLPFMAPEVSGETNCFADHRSDFYSLGVVMYQLFTSQLPFIATDARELINKHIKEQPRSLSDFDIQSPLSDIIMKLLQKKEYRRYPSCDFLLDDLKYALTGKETTWEDLQDRELSILFLPRGIYGREKEMEYLESIYKTVESGVSILLIKGPTGVGKTRLVNELQSRIVSENHFFASWKCNTKTTGFASFISILNNILHQITASSEADVVSAREAIIRVVGSLDLTPLFVHFPELKDILGPNYSKIVQHEKLSANNYKMKPEINFKRLLKSLFIALGQKYPLTLFFDDFQWFSLSDIELLNEIRIEILKEQHESSIIVLATFDSSDEEQLKQFKATLNADFLEMDVGAVRPMQFFQFTHDTFGPEKNIMSVQKNYPEFFKHSISDQFMDVSNAMHEHVGGNILMSVHLFDQINIDDNARFRITAPDSYWVSNLDKINALPWSIDELYERRFNQFFTEDETTLLKLAACIYDNTMFSLDDLVIVSQKSMHEVSRIMYKGLESWLIRPMNIFYKFPFHLGKENLPIPISDKDLRDMSSLSLFALCHDSLYTYIVNKMMDENELAEMHKIIGLRLYHGRKNVDSDALSCMEIANHFSKSYTAVSTPVELNIYLEVLLLAQIFCYKIFDFVPALKFLKISRALIEDKDKEDKDQDLLEIDYEILRCMLKTYDVDGVISFIDSHNAEFREDPRVALVYIQALSILNRTEECVHLATICLNKCGIPLNLDRNSFESQKTKLVAQFPKALSEAQRIIREKGPPLESRTVLQEIMAELMLLSIYKGDLLFTDLLGHYAVVDSLEYGASGFSAVGYISLAIVNVRDSMSISKELSEFAISLLKTSKTVTLDFRNRVFYIYVISIGIYLEQVQELLKFYEVYSSHLSTPSTWSISFIMRAGIRPVLEYLNGSNIQNVYKTLVQSVRKIDLENEINRAWYNTTVTLLRYFLKLPYDEKFDVLKDPEFSIDKAGFLFKCFYFSILQWIKVPPTAHFISAERLERELNDIMEVVPYNLYTVLFITRKTYCIVDDLNTTDESKNMVLSANIKFLHQCKMNSPKVFEAKYFLQRAEMAKLDDASAMEILDAYEEAIESAEKYDLASDSSSFHERCARWLLQTGGSRKRVKKHLHQAARQYQASGLIRRVSDLKQSFPEYFENLQLETASRSSRGSHDGALLSPINYLISSALIKEDGSQVGDLLYPDQDNTDLFMALKATLSVSESINTDAIIENLVKETITLVHAEYAIVALRDDDGVIQYKAVGGPSFFNHLEPDDSDKLSLPRQMIKHTIETGSALESTSSEIDSLIEPDSYFSKSIPKSFVCLPIKSDIEILGALYLENSDIPRLFTKKKLKFAELLSTQAAFALDKARLYYRTMLAKKAAEEATAEKATFLSNMSHEIRTPFNSLFACAGFLLDTDLNPLQLEYVETVQSSAQVALNIIDAILTFSKIEHGSLQLESELFSLNECIESSMQLIAEQAAKKNIEIAYFNKCGKVDMVTGDMTRFKQVVINVLGNSVKFTQEGSIVVKSYARRLSTPNSYEFTVSIEDTGIGIPKDSHTKVFGAFSQVDGSSRRVYGGSGLGLAISKKLMDLMGGSIQFESEEGEGTTFYLSFNSTAKLSEQELQVPKDSKMLIIADQTDTTVSLKEFIEASTANCSVDITSDCDKLTTFEGYLLVFANPVYYEKVPSSIWNSLESSKVVLISTYGKVAKGTLKKKHPVLLLPFLSSKLINLIEHALVPSRSQGNGMKLKSSETETEITNALPKKLLAEHLPLRILLVEDNIVNTKVALLHLKRLGYTADAAVDGVDALEKCTQRIDTVGSNYDLILMDIQMPRKDGIETCKDLRAKYGGTTFMPVIIALTANVETEDRDRCISCGMSDFISKPIRPAVLEKAIRGSGGGVLAEAA